MSRFREPIFVITARWVVSDAAGEINLADSVRGGEYAHDQDIGSHSHLRRDNCVGASRTTNVEVDPGDRRDDASAIV